MRLGHDAHAGSAGEDSLIVARRKIEELSNKHRQLLFNNVELTMKKAEVARTLDAVMREKSAADEEITRLKVSVCMLVCMCVRARVYLLSVCRSASWPVNAGLAF